MLTQLKFYGAVIGGVAFAGGALMYNQSGELRRNYTLVDARLAYRTADYELALWGRNLTDEFYYVSGFDTSAFLADDLTRGEPRTYGVEVRFNF